MNIQAIINKIKQGNLAPCYLVLGTEAYLANIFKNTLITSLYGEEGDDMNIISFDLTETPIEDVISEARTVPFFGEYKLLILENPTFLTGEKKKLPFEHQTDEFINYLTNPIETTILVVMAKYEKLDERKKVVKLLKKQSEIVDVSPMNEASLKKYMQQYITAEGYQIQPNALDELLILTEGDMSKMISELNKIFLYTAETKNINKQVVTELVPKSLEHNIFDLSVHVLSGMKQQAISLFHDLLLQGEETIKLNAILISQVRLLLQVKILLERKYLEQNIAQSLQIHPYRVKLATKQARKFSLSKLSSIFKALVENDYQIKIGSMDKILLFELFVLTTDM